MMYRMQQEERDIVPINRVLGPLPENAFVQEARDSIPEARGRVTTASTRGNLRGRGRGRTNAPRAPTRQSVPSDQGTRSIGRPKSKKRTAETSTNANANVRDGVPAVRGRRSHKGYNVGPGSSHHLLVGDDEMHRRSTAIPDLNVELIPDINARQEVPLSQNAPPADDI
jgi:hypothetical protein